MTEFVGTAGWNVPSAHRTAIALQGTHLQRYASCLNAVEINSSFYRPHQRRTYERWAQSVPDRFRFAVKLPRSITHENALLGCAGLLAAFHAQVRGLAAKLGVVLVQLPPSLPLEERRMSGFFQCVAELPAAIACEPRHASWFTAAATEYLRSHRIARVASDPARFPAAALPGGWPGLAYFRLHGSPQMYFSDYTAPDLQRFRRQFDQASRATPQCWCIFDNTARGAAFGNACEFAKLKLE